MCYAYIYISRACCSVIFSLSAGRTFIHFINHSACVRSVAIFHSFDVFYSTIHFFFHLFFAFVNVFSTLEKLIILEQWIWISFVRLRLSVCVCVCVVTVVAGAYKWRERECSLCSVMRPGILWPRRTYFTYHNYYYFCHTIIIGVAALMLLLLPAVCSIPIAYLPFEFGLINTI